MASKGSLPGRHHTSERILTEQALQRSEESDLISAILRSQRGAWEAFARAYAGVLFNAVRRTLRNGGESAQDACEDVVQEVFIKLCLNDYALLRTFDPKRAKLSTWLGVVAASGAYDHLRKHKRWQMTSSGLGGAAELDTVPEPVDAQAPPDTDLPEIPRDILSPRQALVLTLLYDKDLDVPEAAEQMGVDTQTIRSLRHKALEKLRRHFASKNDEKLASDGDAS